MPQSSGDEGLQEMAVLRMGLGAMGKFHGRAVFRLGCE